jgi:hypothetical protein
MSLSWVSRHSASLCGPLCSLSIPQCLAFNVRIRCSSSYCLAHHIVGETSTSLTVTLSEATKHPPSTLRAVAVGLGARSLSYRWLAGDGLAGVLSSCCVELVVSSGVVQVGVLREKYGGQREQRGVAAAATKTGRTGRGRDQQGLGEQQGKTTIAVVMVSCVS